MKTLQLRTNLHPWRDDRFPFAVYTAGAEEQRPITRLTGFSAQQLLLTFSGTGVFRTLGQDKWDIVQPHTVLYIPAGLPHEYLPQNRGSWDVGFVTFVECKKAVLESWGFGETPFRFALQDIARLGELLAEIWEHSGPQYDMWKAAELFFAFCLEVKKQAVAMPLQKPAAADTATDRAQPYRDSVVDHTVRFLHDYLQRDLTMTEIAAHAGYSSKHLNRLFRQSLGTTPLKYLQSARLQSAALLLSEHPKMTIRQVAAHIGMEANYFTRSFQREYGCLPSQFKARTGE